MSLRLAPTEELPPPLPCESTALPCADTSTALPSAGAPTEHAVSGIFTGDLLPTNSDQIATRSYVERLYDEHLTPTHVLEAVDRVLPPGTAPGPMSAVRRLDDPPRRLLCVEADQWSGIWVLRPEGYRHSDEEIRYPALVFVIETDCSWVRTDARSPWTLFGSPGAPLD